MAQSLMMTEQGYQEMKRELDELKTVKRQEISEKIRVARGFGDLSENSEYDEAKTEQGKLYSRIAEVENLIENAEIIERSYETGKVVIGSTVRVHDLDEDFEEEYTIVGSQEADPMSGRISDDSPFGRGLMGHAVGETVSVEAPAGMLRFKILEITND